MRAVAAAVLVGVCIYLHQICVPPLKALPKESLHWRLCLTRSTLWKLQIPSIPRCLRTCAQSLLSEWRAELARRPLALSEADACAVLGLKPGPDGRVAEDELRRAYRYAGLGWQGCCKKAHMCCAGQGSRAADDELRAAHGFGVWMLHEANSARVLRGGVHTFCVSESHV